jgi:hypothetical protein
MKRPIKKLLNKEKLDGERERFNKLMDDGIEKVQSICGILSKQYDGVTDAELELVMSDYLIYSNGLRELIDRAITRYNSQR